MTDETATELDVETTPNDGGGDMHVHRPKPLHGLREILTEISVIVVGIVIALGGEQAVEALHSAHQIEAAEQAMRLELADDDGPQAFLRLAITPCLNHDLASLHAAINHGAGPQAFGKLVDGYRPPIRTWDMDAWNSTQSSGIGNLMGAPLLQWADAYDFVPFLQTSANQERASLNRLARTRYRVGRWTQATRDDLSDILDDLDSANKRMAENSAIQLLHLHNDGIALPAEGRRSLLAQARADYGDCAVDPDMVLAPAMLLGRRSGEQQRQELNQVLGQLSGDRSPPPTVP